MAPAKTKKETHSNKTTTKKAPVKAAAAAAPKNAKKTTEPKQVSAGNKRKRVTFSETEGKPAKSTKKKAATGKKAPEPKKEPMEESESEDEEVTAATHDDDNDDDQVDDEELTEEQEEALRKEILGDLASSDEGQDSSDDEDDSDAIDKNKDVVSLAEDKMKESMAETKKTFDKKSKTNKVRGLTNSNVYSFLLKMAHLSFLIQSNKEQEKGVIYLGRIPHGFYEKEMKGYFSQFGDITRLRLSRNKKSGRSKHYGFIEFASADVAKIVVETMDNYLLFGHLLQCKLVPSEKVHAELFKGSGKALKRKNYALLNRKIHNKPKTDEQLQKKREQLKQREQKIREQIREAGIEYDFPGFK
ncbi:hypothetical protein BDF20DRAFT_875344 [Mycotypha africana]|uniref:uncharacterized protein n=1 Tax=Mycotypha africana TaxID=64632 RepID=UPI0023000E53|nr:uncharacterized protein BDF20DRAFT_875344 [Mycotypha africana]KAI8977523.1 hypothetical protein BDF20DRAFT_875344 [Mycotypha africana]